MKGIEANKVLGLLDYSWQNVPKLIRLSKKNYDLAPHHYTMQRILMQLVIEGKAESIDIPFGSKITKVYRLAAV